MNMTERKRHVFYSKETGKIFSVMNFTHSQAELNCKPNAKFKMTCKPESEIGTVTNMILDYVDVSVDPHVVKTKTAEAPDYAAKHRAMRNTMLSATDWTVGADSPLSDAKKLEWQTYRQALRDVTFEQYMNWPIQPQ